MFDILKNIIYTIKEHKKFVVPMCVVLAGVAFLIAVCYIGFFTLIDKNMDSIGREEVDNIIYDINKEFTHCTRAAEMIAKEISGLNTEEERYNRAMEISGYVSEIYGMTFQLYSRQTSPDTYTQRPDGSFNIYSGQSQQGNSIMVEYYTDALPVVVAAAIDEDVIYNHTSRWIFITDSAGKIVSTNMNSLSTTDRSLNSVLNDNISEKILSEDSGNGAFTYEGEKYVCYYGSIDNNWRVVMAVNTKEFYGKMYGLNIWIVFLALAILTITAVLYYNSYASNLRKEEAMKTQSVFFANMSHEIRTPLNAIIGMSEILLRRDISPQVRNDALAIHNAGTGLLTIINDILDFSKMDSGKFEIINDEYYFPALISEVVNLVSFRIQDPDILFLTDINPNIPLKLTGDEVRIKQILMNLLGNSVKFTKKGNIKLEADWSFIDNGETTLTFKVSDTGIGIKPDELPGIFTEYKQADKKLNRTVTGTGLGLAISRNLARQMGGDITVDSQYGKGTVFTVKIKNKVKNYEPIAVVHENNKHNVIIYETDENILSNLRSIFKKLDVLYSICKVPDEIKDVKKCTHILFRTKFRKDIGRIYNTLDPKPHVIEVTDLAGRSGDSPVESRPIFLPLISLNIADFLNGEFGREYNVSDVKNVVTAPDANVLIVDDNATNTAVAKGLLAGYGMKIDTADNGADAVQMVKTKKYDIVFMDNMMPVMDGTEATKIIRSTPGPYFRRLPIVALTATVSRTTKDEFLNNGFNEYLSKPMDLNKLDAILHKYLEHKMIKSVRPANIKAEDVIGDTRDSAIDFNTGIQQLGGSRQTYVQILNIFANDIKKKQAVLPQYINENDTHAFTIDVHALKSAAANVRADKLSTMAAEMEELGKKTDIQTIYAKADSFFEEMAKVSLAADQFLANTVEKKEKTLGEVDPADIYALKESCASLDMVAIEEITGKLDSFVYAPHIQQYVDIICHSSKEFDYSTITEAADKLLKILGQ